MDKNLLYLLTILEAIEKIYIYTKEFSTSDEFFRANMQKEFNAVLNLLIAIGEESKKLDQSLKEKCPSIDWKAISALRNELSHDYRGVDYDIIWDIVVNYLGPLKEVCIKLVDELGPDFEKLQKVLKSDYYQNISYLLKNEA